MNKDKLTPEQAKIKIEEYFRNYPTLESAKNETEKAYALQNIRDGIKPTISGLSYFLGFRSVKTYDNYSKKPRFRKLFESTKLRLVSYWEQGLAAGRGSQGCSQWLGVIAPDTFAPKQQTQANNGLQIIIVGQDGNKTALSNIIDAQTITAPKPELIEASPTDATPRKA